MYLVHVCTTIQGVHPILLYRQTICDRIWENPPCSEFYKIFVSCIFDKLYPRANLYPSLRPIARFA